MHQRVNSYRDLKEFAQASIEWSERRRSRARIQTRRDRVIDGALFIPAVLGLIMIIRFCAYPFPVEHWPMGLIAVVLMIPYLTRRFN